jgi:hypothetical protein
MWKGNKIEVKEVLEIVSEKPINFKKLFIDNIEIISSIDQLEFYKVDWDEGIFEGGFCDFWGEADSCVNGPISSYRYVRKSNNKYFFILAFEYFINDKNGLENLDKGFGFPQEPNVKNQFYLEHNEFQQLCELNPFFIEIIIKELKIFDLISLYKWQAPKNFFGKLPFLNNEIDYTKILHVSDGNDIEFILALITQQLEVLSNYKGGFNLQEINNPEKIISLVFENNPFLEWQVLYDNSKEYELVIDKNLLIKLL